MVRIRKNALKLLGSDYLYAPPPPAAAEWWDPQCGGGGGGGGGGGEEVMPCRLNCSPWDVLVGPNSSWFQEEGEEEEEGRGIMGNGLKFEEYEEIMATFEAIPSNAEGGDYGTTDGKKKKKKTRIRKRKEEGNKNGTVALAKSRPVVVICSKNDGKGWHCKRPANPRHTLCNHHLDLLRSYSLRTNSNSNSNSKRESCVDNSETDEPQVKNQIWPMAAENHRPKAVAAATETAGDGFYYYYSGFGPWRGKKRSSTARANDDDDDEKKGEERMNESGDGSDGPVAGDDLDDDDEDDDIEDGIENCGRVLKKKRRKRVKARSLKSLM